MYWERKYPEFDKNGFVGMKNFSNGNIKGMIRVIGRFWKAQETGESLDQFYRRCSVRLVAALAEKVVTFTLRVIKPTKLGTKDKTSVDVDNNTIDIDEICIKYGGEKGIPPQFLKGQMRKETSPYHPFYPTYLYEPYTTQFRAFSNNPGLETNLYYIKPDATTFNPSAPNYSVVKDFNFPTSPVSVWDMIEQYSELESLNNDVVKYGKRVATKNSTKEHGVLSFYGVYKDPQTEYNKYLEASYEKYKISKHPKNEPKANDEARENFINFLKNEWDGGISGGKKGLTNIKAQTRIAASYGLIQLTYPTAIATKYGVNYPVDNDNLPEKLLETVNLKWAIKYLTYLLKKAILDEHKKEKQANWDDGLEGTFSDDVWPSWNSITSYPSEVLNFAKAYSPIK